MEGSLVQDVGQEGKLVGREGDGEKALFLRKLEFPGQTRIMG